MVVFAIAHGSGRVRMLLRLLEEQASGDEGCREARRLLEPRQGSWLAGERYLEALAAAIAAARDPLLLIRLGLSYDPRLSGPLGFLMRNKPTVRDSLGTLARCCGLTVRGATFALADDEPCAILRYD